MGEFLLQRGALEHALGKFRNGLGICHGWEQEFGAFGRLAKEKEDEEKSLWWNKGRFAASH